MTSMYELSFPCFYSYYSLREGWGGKSLVVGVEENYQDPGLNDMRII